MKWNEVAHDVFDDSNREPIKGDATNLAKFGAPAVGVVTALLTAVLGESWSLDPSRPAVLFAAAIIIAATVLGIYFAFASDIRTRGAVTVARLNAIAELAGQESDRDAEDAQAKELESAKAARSAAEARLADSEAQRKDAERRLDLVLQSVKREDNAESREHLLRELQFAFLKAPPTE